MIKICHLTSVHPRYDTRIFIKQCKSLAIHNMDTHLVVADGLGDELKDKVKIIDVGFKQGRIRRILLTTILVYKKALELDCEIYHLHDPELVPVGTKLKRLGKKVDAPTSKLGQTTLGQAMRLKPYQIALMLAFINNWILFGLRSSILPLFVIEELKSTAAIAGLGLTIGALVQGLFMLKAGKYSDQKGRKAALLFGSAFVLFGILMLAFTTNAALYFISMALFGLGGAYVGTAPGSVVGDIIRGRGGQVIAAWQMAGDAGMIFGPVVVGLLTDLYSYQTAFLVSAGIWIIAIVLATFLPETRMSHMKEDLIPDKNKQEL